jgi:hypothetical protein
MWLVLDTFFCHGISKELIQVVLKLHDQLSIVSNHVEDCFQLWLAQRHHWHRFHGNSCLFNKLLLFKSTIWRLGQVCQVRRWKVHSLCLLFK